MKRRATIVALTIAIPLVGMGSAEAVPGAAAIADFDGDGISDLSVVTSAGTWSYIPSGGPIPVRWGFSWGNGYEQRPTDQLAPGDYDGDHKTDPAVFIAAEGRWQLSSSRGLGPRTVWFGAPDDRAVPGDYDGDGMADVAVYRPSEGEWHILPLKGGSQSFAFGGGGDVPAPGDYDGDGKTDLGVFRPRETMWIVRRSSDGVTVNDRFGLPTDTLVPSDYDGDGKTDVANFRPATGEWWIHRSGDGGVEVHPLGEPADVPAPADYDGDGRTDVAVYRPAAGRWIIEGNPDVAEFGRPGDVPVAGAYLPR